MSKTPYEVRLDVLKMAQEMLDRETFLKEQVFLSQVETLRTTNIGGVNAFVQENSPSMYTPEEVITRANALYGFISNKSSDDYSGASDSRSNTGSNDRRK